MADKGIPTINKILKIILKPNIRLIPTSFKVVHKCSIEISIDLFIDSKGANHSTTMIVLVYCKRVVTNPTIKNQNTNNTITIQLFTSYIIDSIRKRINNVTLNINVIPSYFAI
jgi:hypothetical protein